MIVINNIVILLVISSMSVQCVNSQDWDLTDIENMDNLLSSWLSYGRRIYYEYQLEADTLYCVFNGIWNVARDHIIEHSRINSQSTIPKILDEADDKSSIEKSRLKRNTQDLVLSKQRKNGSGLASLLGITSKRLFENYDRSTVRVKKNVDQTWKNVADHDDDDDNDNDNNNNDDVKPGDLERAILKTLARNNPLVGILLNFLGKFMYLIHSMRAFMRSSVVLNCLSDYTIARSSEFMYMNI